MYRNRRRFLEGAKPHPRVSEEQHRTYRLDTQSSALRTGKPVAVPSRRIHNAALQRAGEVPSQTHQRDATEGERKPLPGRRINERRTNSHNKERNSTRNDTDSDNHTGKTSRNGSLSTIEHAKTHIQDPIIMRTETESNGLEHFTPTHEPETTHYSVQMRVVHVRPAEDEAASKLRTSKADSTTTSYGTGFFSEDETDGPSAEIQANSHRINSSSTSSGRVSAFVEHLNDQYAPPFDESSNPPLVDLQDHKHPHPAPPKKKPLNFMQRRKSVSSQASKPAGSLTRNFRKLRLDLQHSTKLASKRISGSDSPDWACRTSLAIEAGRISMDSVSKQARP